jgi:Fe2+ or Zn2+ uptake regulation protein
MRARGFRVTPQRTIILETIAHMGGHLSAQQVHHEASKRLPGLNLATVYRTVESLQKSGLVDIFSTTQEPLQFSLRDPEQPHAHLVCRSCGKVQQVDGPQLEALHHVLREIAAFEIDPHHLTLEGLCMDCQLAGGDQLPGG